MKKIMSVLVCVLLLEFLNACSNNENIPIYNNENTLIDKSYIINNQILENDGIKISWKLEFPVLDNENDYYNEINKVILNDIVKFTELPHYDEKLEGHYYYTGTYEIAEQTEKIFSLYYVVSVFYEYGASPTEYCYGLTYDLETGEKNDLSVYINDMESILKDVERGDYSVCYGAFSTMTNEEVRKEVENTFLECELDTSFNNFYIDDGICLIINDVIGSDYSIIKLPQYPNI